MTDPTAKPSPVDDRNPPIAPPLPAAKTARLVRVLLAEDNHVNQRLATLILQKHRCDVTIAATGADAVALSCREPFDICFMDLQMPEMGGIEATTLIRQREAVEGGHLPIVAMTAHTMAEDRQRCLDAGMDDYLCKPIERAQLVALIDRLTVSTSI